jgi:hypothetical protein
MRFGRNRSAPAERPAEDDVPPTPAEAPAATETPPASTEPRELFARYARKDGTLVAMLRAVERDGACLVEAEVHPAGSSQAVAPGPYRFADAQEASAFVTEAVTALMHLGCDIQAQ